MYINITRLNYKFKLGIMLSYCTINKYFKKYIYNISIYNFLYIFKYNIKWFKLN